MAFRLARPSHLVDINGVAALNRIAVADGKLVIGACVRHAAFHRPVCDGPLGKLLTDVVRHIAHYPIRNRGTFCGSLAHADPASEWCLVLAALDGEVLAKSARGERVIAARDFFKGIMTTALADDELLVEARLPILAAGTACGFYEFSRRAGDFALAAAVGIYRLDGGKMVKPRLAVGGAEANPRRIAEAERALEGAAPGDTAFRAAAKAATAAIAPLEDIINSAEFRRDLVLAVTRRALECAASVVTWRLVMLRSSPRNAGTTFFFWTACFRGNSTRLIPSASRGRRRKKWIGQSVERLEDPPLVAGRGAFAGDINFPHQLHMRVVRSAHAHGRIVSIDTAAARALPGVFAVWTAADIAQVPPVDFREGSIPALDPYRQPVLATERVRYVGDPVAAIFAADPYVAEDAADLVTMAIGELPPLLDASAAPGEFSAGHSSEAAVIRQGYGDVDAVFRTAAHIVALELAIGRHSGVPLETRGAIGRYDAARDILELHGAAKVPHRNQELLSRMLGIPLSGIHVHEFACRRRLRHPRRALSRGCSGLRRRQKIQPAGEMDRRPARAPDRGQSFAPATAQDPRRGGR